MEAWQKLLAAAAGATGVAALLYYLLQEDVEGEADAGGAKDAALVGAAKGGGGGGLSKEELLQVLKDMVEQQRGTAVRLKGIAKDMSAKEGLGFDAIYDMVAVADSEDPLAIRGLTMNDLEGPLSMNQNDPMVMMAMQALMTGGQDDMVAPTSPVKEVSMDKVKEINNFLLVELESFITSYKAVSDKSKYEIKTIMIMVQATLDSKVIRKFDFESADVQAATMKYQKELSQDRAFIEGHMGMQQKMETFVKFLQASGH